MHLNATAADKETKAFLRRELWSCNDVRQLMRLERLNSGRWMYLIETPFATFPKFVIGTLDDQANGARIELQCGAEWNALNHWEELKRQDAAMAAEPAESPDPVRSLTT